MGHRQKMTDNQRLKFDLVSYKRKLEANKGFNFQYHNEELEIELKKKGYKWHIFSPFMDATKSVLFAKEEVKKLRKSGHYARIICGRTQTQQKEKHYSIAYKLKK